MTIQLACMIIVWPCIHGQWRQCVHIHGLAIITCIADPSIHVSVSLTHNSLSIIERENHSNLLETNDNLIGCYNMYPLPCINLIKDLKNYVVIIIIIPELNACKITVASFSQTV